MSCTPRESALPGSSSYGVRASSSPATSPGSSRTSSTARPPGRPRPSGSRPMCCPTSGDRRLSPATRSSSRRARPPSAPVRKHPRKPPARPRPDPARQRSRRQRRAASLLAVVLLLVAGGIGALAYRDYAAQRVGGDYTLAIIAVENDLSSARRSADRKPPDVDAARDRLTHAQAKLDEAARSPIADQAKIAALRDELAKIDDDITGVVVDLARLLPGAKPAAIVGNLNGLYVADPGVGRLWRIFGDPAQTGVVLAQGARDVGVPRLVATFGDAVYALDDQQHLWRAQGDKVADVTPDAAADTWKSVASFSVFAANLYVLDAASGQVWKHESSDGIDFDRNRVQGYLETAVAPNAAASLAVDGDVWIVTTTGEVIRYRRLTTSFMATRVDFTARWTEPVRPAAIQAIDVQRSIYFLDAQGKKVTQMGRDGREVARFNLPTTLPARPIWMTFLPWA